MSFILDLVIIVILCALANSILGIFLVLRGTSLISFGLAHSILFGIVIAFLITNSLNSPLLLIGAALTGVLIVSLVELISSSKYIQYDAALGLIYLTIFALGIIILSKFAQNSTLSLNSVITGQLLFTAFFKTSVFGLEVPTITLILGSFLLLNSLFTVVFYKEIVITSFDPEYAKLIGYSPKLMNYLLMILTSLTIVGSYQAVGAVLVVAFIIAPPATAILYTKQLRYIIVATVFIAVTGGVAGFYIAFHLDLAMAGSIATVYGMIFIISMVIAPRSTLRQFLTGTEDKVYPPPDYIVEHGGE